MRSIHALILNPLLFYCKIFKAESLCMINVCIKFSVFSLIVLITIIPVADPTSVVTELRHYSHPTV